jgi:hypothetical protein
MVQNIPSGNLAQIAVTAEALIRNVHTRGTDFGEETLQSVFATLAEGATTKTLEITLRRNSLVRTFDVVVTAAAASRVPAGVAGQLRTSSKGPRQTSIVVDFGALRTVAAVMLPEGITAVAISTWIGTKFSDSFSVDPAQRVTRLPSEVRTERIEVIASGSVDAARLATEMFFLMPDLPSGLELRIDDGPPVFTHPAPVQPGTETQLSDNEWNSEARRVVHLAGTFAKLTGDSTRDEPITFKLTLSSKSPGSLDLLEHAREIRYIRRATFDGATEKDIEFKNEGQATIRLDSLPEDLNVDEVRWNASGTVPATRALPAVGPEASGVAEIRITPDRALIVRLNPATPIGELSGLRWPLRVGASGAEARIVLWKNKPGANQPLEPIEAGTSDPATLSKSDVAEWITFAWSQPAAIPDDGLWAALTLNRGEAYVEFAGSNADTSSATALWGAPAGPWRSLPAALADQRGRLRLIGTPKSGVKIDPYSISAGPGSSQGFTPNPKGVIGVLTLNQPVRHTGRTELKITSFVSGNLKLRDVEIVSTN